MKSSCDLFLNLKEINLMLNAFFVAKLMACKDVSSPVDNDTFKDLEVQVCFISWRDIF